MELYRLDIRGFKSFGDPISIQFDKGVTGIVGPNGSGKSNIVDAIRWVLGEQKTRVLRSDKMDNVIFNGTRKRKPSQVAEVSLSFDNNKNILPAEYSKVNITRRYSRDGSSQYFLNNVPCRLKDINNLFLDTGIGSDSYAIIELKMVDEILTDKENSRRNLFEKAAGIAKYKLRKREALKQLEGVDKDLNRVEDLLYEIEKNLKALEKQAQQAELFFQLKKEYRKISVVYARKSVGRLQVSKEDLEKRIGEESEKRNNFAEGIQEKEALIEQEKEEVIKSETQFYDFQKALNEHLSEVKTLENEQKLKSERLRFLQEKSSNLSSQIIQEERNLKEVQENLKELEERKNKVQEEFEEVENLLRDVKEAYEAQKTLVNELQSQFKSKENANRSWEQKVFELQKDFDIKSTKLQSLTQEIEQIHQEKANLSEQVEQYENDFYEEESRLNELQSELEELQNFEEENQIRKQNLESKKESSRQELQKLNRLFDAKKNEITLTKSLLENLEGFADSLKFLKKNADNWTSKAPVLLSEVLQYEEKYRLALQAFLELYADYYVVQNEAEAFKAIDLLKQENKGRANFFILDKLPPTPQKIAAPQGLLAALDLVNYSSEYESLITRLLQNVLIVPINENFEKHLSTGMTLISENGQLLSRKFILTGGTQQKGKTTQADRLQKIQSLENEIQDLEIKIQDLESELQSTQENIENCNSQSKKEEIRFAQTNLSEVKESFITIKTKKEQTERILGNIEHRLSDVKNKETNLKNSTQEILPQIKEAEAELENSKDQIEELSQQLEIENESLTMKSSRFNQQNITYHQQKSKLENIEQELDYKEKNQKNIQERIEQYKNEQGQSRVDLEKLNLALQENDKALYQLNSQTEKFRSDVQESEKVYYSQRGRIADQEKLVKEMQRQKDLLDSLLQELNNKLNDINLKLTALRERLAAEFQLNLDDVLREQSREDLESEMMSESELKSKVEATKKRLERLGNINPMAMQNYQDMKERFDFIDTQRQDLLNSKMTLLKTINEMEDFARKSFMESYEKIRKNFIYVFRSLFSEEDTADLVLTDPESPLDSKIEIIAKPKGKRPLTINQLSGGEKTLTATSLLFALYLLKPAPFCIFDEVDAPLDDANTDKFNQIIKTFSKDSQFIIVTHNKRTMSQTDVMYGITMIEQGISKVIPVDLRSLD